MYVCFFLQQKNVFFVSANEREYIEGLSSGYVYKGLYHRVHVWYCGFTWCKDPRMTRLEARRNLRSCRRQRRPFHVSFPSYGSSCYARSYASKNHLNDNNWCNCDGGCECDGDGVGKLIIDD